MNKEEKDFQELKDLKEKLSIITKEGGIEVKIYIAAGYLPEIATSGAAAVDLRANLALIKPKFIHDATMLVEANGTYKAVDYVEENKGWAWNDDGQLRLEIKPHGRVLIPTGLHIELPKGFKANIRPRSGLALKHGITVLNSPGLIDEDYRGDVGVILINNSNYHYIVEQGDRVAQLEVEPVSKFSWEPVKFIDDLSSTDRGKGGFGSTGKK